MILEELQQTLHATFGSWTRALAGPHWLGADVPNSYSVVPIFSLLYYSFSLPPCLLTFPQSWFEVTQLLPLLLLRQGKRKQEQRLKNQSSVSQRLARLFFHQLLSQSPSQEKVKEISPWIFSFPHPPSRLSCVSCGAVCPLSRRCLLEGEKKTPQTASASGGSAG